MDVQVTPPPLPVLDQADPLFRAHLLWHQERLRAAEAERNDLRRQLDASVDVGLLNQARLPAGQWAQIPIEVRRLIAAQAQRIEALEAPLKQLEDGSGKTARRRTTTPILNLSLDVWEQIPPIVQQLLVGLYQQVRQMAAAPTSDPALNLPLDVWEAANPLVRERLIELCEQVEALSQQVRLLRGQIFGAKSEKIPEGSAKKDGETPSADAGNDQESPPQHEPTGKKSPAAQPAVSKAGNAESTEPAEAKRRRGFRKPLPEELPRVIETHDIDDAEKQCGCGKTKSCIGAEDASRVEFVPAHLRVILCRRTKWVCRACEGLDDTLPSAPQPPATPSATPGAEPDMTQAGTNVTPVVGEAGPSEPSATPAAPAAPSAPAAVRRPVVSIAPAPKELIPKGIATASLLAHIVVSKFLDSLPLYRQEAQFARVGLRIPRSTMTRWLLKVYRACVPLLEVLHKEVLAARVIGADETEVQVLKEPNRLATSKSYMWLFRGGTDDKPAIQLVYAPTRSAEVAKNYLRGYKGGVQTDGYVGYDFLDKVDGIVHLGCMAHARRKFVDVCKAVGKNWKKSLRGVAGETILAIRELYAIERQVDSHQMTEAQRHEVRQVRSKPLMDALHDRLMKAQGTCLPTSKLGEAVGYALNQWGRLERYLETGYYRIDNNLVENDFRPFAVGRRNWLFCYSQDGARASACFYSLILAAKANGLDPYHYLKALFERLPYANPGCDDDYRSLLPQYIDRALLVPKQV